VLKKTLYVLPNGKFIGQVDKTLDTQEYREQMPMTSEWLIVVDDTWELVFIDGEGRQRKARTSVADVARHHGIKVDVNKGDTEVDWLTRPSYAEYPTTFTTNEELERA
jgi:hypothetical protein